MTSLQVGLLAATACCGGFAFGVTVRRMLPDTHRDKATEDSIKVGTGMIATLTALVLGLLVGSAKANFDSVSAGLTNAGASAIVLDRVLADYGDETAEARTELRATVVGVVRNLWPDHPVHGLAFEKVQSDHGVEVLLSKIRALKPQSEAQKQMQTQAIGICNDLLMSRWLMVERELNDLPLGLLVALVSWLALLFATIGLFAARNATAYAVLCLCALSMSSAVFMVSELNQPIDGIIKVSRGPLTEALNVIGQAGIHASAPPVGADHATSIGPS